MKFQSWLEESWADVGYPIKLACLNHGDLSRWLDSLNSLPELENAQLYAQESLAVKAAYEKTDLAQIENAVKALIPWRKGPLNIVNMQIDSEWRSDMKWDRVVDYMDWSEKKVLDVGCGNGYFGFRAIGAGARSVLGLDSSILFVMQAAFVNWFARSQNVVLPLRFGQDSVHGRFDIVLSMGVIYHQRDQQAHVSELAKVCQSGGEVVLESIIADEDLAPSDRYAGMKNIWCVPSITSLKGMLKRANFLGVRVVDISTTTTEEQRTTQHMPFQSLINVLKPNDPSLTIEGYPAPKRAVLIARKA